MSDRKPRPAPVAKAGAVSGDKGSTVILAVGIIGAVALAYYIANRPARPLGPSSPGLLRF